ncbi:hypothetical protein ACFLQP_03030 [Acidobacteriota bacterium]
MRNFGFSSLPFLLFCPPSPVLPIFEAELKYFLREEIMSNSEYVIITNECDEKIKVEVRYLRKKKPSPSYSPKPFTLSPRQKSHPLPVHVLKNENYKALKARDCVSIDKVAYEPQFVQITNCSEKELTFDLGPTAKVAMKAKTTIKLKPGEQSRIVNERSLLQRSRLKRLAQKKKVTVDLIYDIGPSTGRGKAVASYGYEDVYICHECGGPIVFRGSPPRPIHI